jgi:hypothetical protein
MKNSKTGLPKKYWQYLFHLIPAIHLNGYRTATIVLRLETDNFSLVVIRKRAKVGGEIGCDFGN